MLDSILKDIKKGKEINKLKKPIELSQDMVDVVAKTPVKDSCCGAD